MMNINQTNTKTRINARGLLSRILFSVCVQIHFLDPSSLSGLTLAMPGVIFLSAGQVTCFIS